MSGISFVRKLESFQSFSKESAAAILALAGQRTRILKPGEDMISEGDEPRTIYLILDGRASMHGSSPTCRASIARR